MSEPLNETIARAIERFDFSKPLNIQDPQTIEDIAGTSVTNNDVKEEIIQIGIDQDSVVVLDPRTSEILSKKPKAEAYMQMIGATKSEHRFKRKLFEENLKSAQQHMRFSLVAAGIGFLIVLGGVVTMMLGYSQAGIVTSAAGIVSELVSVLFFNQARHFSERLDNTLDRLLDAEGFFRAFAIAEQLPKGEFRDRLFETIAKKMIGITSDHSVLVETDKDIHQS